MTGPTPLQISPNINPISGTGSDIHGSEFSFEFGSINVGTPEITWQQKIMRDVAIAIAVGLVAKTILGRL